MNRIEKIKAFKDAQTISAMEEATKEEIEVLKYKLEIAKLKLRIAELIETANACLENGIDINKCGSGIHYNSYSDKYEYGSFVTNGITHHVGFIHEDGGKIAYIGIENGGMNGNYDFYTNGTETFYIDTHKHLIAEADIYDLKKFIGNFSKFENSFYEYVDRITESF